MRIFNFISNLSGGGAERQLSYLAPELVRIGHEVHIAYIYDGPHVPELNGVLLYKLKAKSNYDPYLVWQLFWLIRTIKPDVIQTWNSQMDILGGIASRINNIPWILREPSSCAAYTGTWKQRLKIIVGSGLSAIVSNSRGGQEYWKFQLPSVKCYVIKNGLPLYEIEQIAATLPLEIGQVTVPILLYVGRFEEKPKNPKIFLEVIAYLKPKLKVIGILCGDGPQRSELEELRHSLGLNAEVYFTGYLPSTQIWSLMKRATVFVSFSAWEGCPNTVMEAMVCECPLVISDIPAHREILNENCTLFINPSDIQQTADTIMFALSDATTSKGRAILAKQKAEAWSITEMTKKYEKIFNEII